MNYPFGDRPVGGASGARGETFRMTNGTSCLAGSKARLLPLPGTNLKDAQTIAHRLSGRVRMSHPGGGQWPLAGRRAVNRA